jgi:hypothetical protein
VVNRDFVLGDAEKDKLVEYVRTYEQLNGLRVLSMKVRLPSPKTIAISNALSSAPPKRLPVDQVRAQVIQHPSESKLEILKTEPATTGR